MNPTNPMHTEFTIDSLQTSNLEEQFPEHTAKAELRNQINAKAGDIESQHGTMADVSQMLCYGFLLFMQSLEDAESIDELRAVAKPFAAIAEDFFAKIATGETQLPFIQKGMGKVVDDMAKRATAAAEALEAKEQPAVQSPVQMQPMKATRLKTERPKTEEPKAEMQVEAKTRSSGSAKWQVAPQPDKVIETEAAVTTEEVNKVQNVNKRPINQHIARIMGN